MYNFSERETMTKDGFGASYTAALERLLISAIAGRAFAVLALQGHLTAALARNEALLTDANAALATLEAARKEEAAVSRSHSAATYLPLLMEGYATFIRATPPRKRQYGSSPKLFLVDLLQHGKAASDLMLRWGLSDVGPRLSAALSAGTPPP